MTAALLSQYKNPLEAGNAQPITSINQTKANFSEGVAAQFRFLRDEGLTNSKLRAFDPFLEERQKAIDALTGDARKAPQYGSPATLEPWYREALGLVSSGEVKLDANLEIASLSPRAKQFTKRINPDYLRSVAVANQLHRQFPDTVLSDAQLATKVTETLKGKRDVNVPIIQRAPLSASIVGAAAASMTDPFVLATLPIGMGQLQGTRIMLNAAKAFGSEFVVGASAQAISEANTYDFKKSIDSPYTKGEAVLNILAAGLGAGVLRATVGSAIDLGVGLARSMEIKGAKEALIRSGVDPVEVERLIAELDNRPLSKPPDVGLQTHSDAIDRAVVDVSEGRLASAPEVDAEVARLRAVDDAATASAAADSLNVKRAELTAEAGNKLNPEDRLNLEGERQSLQQLLESEQSQSRLVELLDATKTQVKTVEEAQAIAASVQKETIAIIQERLSLVQNKIARDDVSRTAEADLSRLEQSILQNPVEAAVAHGFPDPRPIREAIRRVVDDYRAQSNEAPFYVVQAQQRLVAGAVAGLPSVKPKVDKGAVPEALKAPAAKPTEAKSGSKAGEAPVIEKAVEPTVDDIPDVPVATAIREDGTQEVQSARKFINELNEELQALDRLDACMAGNS